MEETYSLRPLKPKDADRMLEWMRDDDVTEYLRIGGKDTQIETVRNFIASAADESVNLHRAVVDSNDIYFGTVSLKGIDPGKKEAEYAIAMHGDAIGHGISRIATAAILEAAANQLHLKRVFLNVRADNLRAVRFYEKCGFRFTHETTEEINGQKTILRWYEALTV